MQSSFPYDDDVQSLDAAHVPTADRWLLAVQDALCAIGSDFGKTHREIGRPCVVRITEFSVSRFETPLSHHLRRCRHPQPLRPRPRRQGVQADGAGHQAAGGRERGRAPGLLGLLNSSVACFWMKQVCSTTRAARSTSMALATNDAFEDFYEFNATKVAEFPLAARPPADARPHASTRSAQRACRRMPAALLAAADGSQPLPTRATLDAARDRAASLRRQMIAAQEELDWQCYRLYGLLPPGTDADARMRRRRPKLRFGERAFEIVLARRMAAGGETTTWFERHGSTPITEIPAHWPEDYRRVVAAPHRPDRARPQHRPDRAPRVQAPLEHAVMGRPGAAPRCATGCSTGWRRRTLWPAGADQPPQLTTVNRLADARARRRRLHAGRRAVRRPRRLRPRRSSSPNWSPARPCPSCRCCATPTPACASARSGKTPGRCSAREDAGEKVGNDPRAAQVQDQRTS